MKNFHVFTFFFVMIAIDHVHGAGSQNSDRSTGSDEKADQNSSSESVELDEHDCDPLAANTMKNSKRSGPDLFNQVLPIKAFLQYFQTNDYNVARATPSPVEPTDNTSLKFCHVPFLRRDCGPLRYYQKLSGVYDPTRKEGFKGIKLNVAFVAMNLENGKAIRYNMEIEGINEDDYIFQWIKNTPITAYEIGDNGERKVITSIPEDVLISLRSEFALNRVGLTPAPQQFNLPDGDRSEYADDEDDQEIDDDDETHVENAEEIENIPEKAHAEDTKDERKLSDQHVEDEEKLKSKFDETHVQDAKEITKNSDVDDDEEIKNEFDETQVIDAKELKKKYEENFENRDLLYMIYTSCDGKSIWAAYSKSIADIDEEGAYAQEMDEHLLQLRQSVAISHKAQSPVKPVSTYMPIRFDETISKVQDILVS